ncbi:MAG: hypothetical protein R3E66_13015 [bacterium]
MFSLLLPDGLRHRESEERRRVLAELDKDDAAQPKYVRDFKVVYSVEAFAALASGEPEPAPVKGTSDEEIEAAKATIAVERQQLADLRERFDKERGQLDAIEERLNAERAELKAARESLEAERRRLEAEKLNLEQRQIQELSGGPISNAEEATQVVTDDQFLELQGTEEAEELASEVSEILDEGIEEFEPDRTLINPLTTGLPSRFAEYKAPGDRVTTLRDDHLVFAARAPRADIEAVFSDDTEFYVQLHVIEDYPVIGVVLVNLDDDKVTNSIGWALDVANAEHQKCLDRLCHGSSARLGLYEPLGSLLRAVEIQAPLRANVLWIVDEANRLLDTAGGSFEPSAKAYLDRNFERVGPMRHPFFAQTFEDLESTSEIKLAAGIMGFWTQPERLAYVIANRSFPLRRLEAARDRVVTAAVNSGIFLAPALPSARAGARACVLGGQTCRAAGGELRRGVHFLAGQRPGPGRPMGQLGRAARPW